VIGTVKSRLPEIVTAYHFSKSEIFRLLVQLGNMAPLHPSQFLICNRSTSSMTLSRFLGCSEKFPTYPFALFGADSLNIEARRSLLGFVSKLFEEDKKN